MVNAVAFATSIELNKTKQKRTEQNTTEQRRPEQEANAQATRTSARS